MVIHLFVPSPVYSIISLLFLLPFIPESYCDPDKDYAECVKPFKCGKFELRYPFWGSERPANCGHEGFELQCEPEYPVLTMNDRDFQVLAVNDSTKEMTIAPMNYWDNTCPQNLLNTSLNGTPFDYLDSTNISVFYNCNMRSQNMTGIRTIKRFQCPVNGEQREAFYGTVEDLELQLGDALCNRVDVPIPWISVEKALEGIDSLMGVLKEGFNVSYEYEYEDKCRECEHSDGVCGTNPISSSFSCLCPSSGCNRGRDRNVKVKVAIGIGTGFGSVIIMCIIFYIYLRRKKKAYAPSSYVSQSMTSDYSFSKSDLEKGSIYKGVHLFSYVELEEATNNFDSARELGEGGFGTVYHGTLRDGRAVAVKRLYENNYKRVEQFMNEVDILTRLRHKNLVSLYGCTSRHSRELLLVYEYISNGTVADHLHGEKAKPGSLPWSTRMKIAVETAGALCYLHASDIIHRDVKTYNILLDDNFCVKVADFGLSRLFPIDVTHVSTAPQGTPGYVDPEYHQCYQLTDKSDVYSFGVVLIELISSMPAVDITRHRHEINLSNMAINKIQSGQLDELVDQSLGFQSDYAIRKMITAVAELAFQCLQGDKDLRPSMGEVVRTLKEIESKDYTLLKAEEMDIQSDDIGLLKSGPLPMSPDTVMTNWTSSSTTPNFSG